MRGASEAHRGRASINVKGAEPSIYFLAPPAGLRLEPRPALLPFLAAGLHWAPPPVPSSYLIAKHSSVNSNVAFGGMPQAGKPCAP